jgi:hypothetical protein
MNTKGSLTKNIKLSDFMSDKLSYGHLKREYDELVPYIKYLIENLTIDQVRMCVRSVRFSN